MALLDHVMTISGNGQVSIPADTRSRWNTRRVLVVDLGDHIVMKPYSEDSARSLRGAYRGSGPTSDERRQQARAEADTR